MLLWVSLEASLVAWGDRKPERPKTLLLLFHISLLVTGLTSPQGNRGIEKERVRKRARKGERERGKEKRQEVGCVIVEKRGPKRW